MAPKRKRSEYEKEWRREEAGVENEKNSRAWALKRINQSLESDFEKEKNKFIPHELPAIVTDNKLVHVQRAGFLDSLKKLKVSDLETVVHMLSNCNHPLVKTIMDALEKYEESLPLLEISSSVYEAQVAKINFEEDAWEETKPKRAEDLCCLLLENEHDYATLLWNHEEEWEKAHTARKHDMWRLQQAMHFIKEGVKEGTPSTVVKEPGPSMTLVPKPGACRGKEKVRGQDRGRGKGKGKGKITK